MNSNLISRAVRSALVASAVSAVAAPAVFAQNATPATGSDQNANTAQLGKIEVTGTRIKRTSVETAQPITVVTSKEIKDSGFASVGDVLQNLTSAGSALNSQVNNGNDGEENVDLRNLGPERLLVLVNGQRWVPQINNVVDFYTIPSSIIDHIEILQDGASAIYGSDAIAGVINIVTIKNYNGAEANAYLGVYHGNGHTDGKKQEYDFTIGSNGDRGGIAMNVSYTNESGILAGDRKISKEAIYGVGGGSSAVPGGNFHINSASICGAMPGVKVGASGCDVTLKNPGATPTPNATTDWRNFSFGQDAYNYAPVNYLLAPNERTSMYVEGHYDLADNLTFTSTVLFNNRQSIQQLAPEPLFLGEQAFGETNQGVNIGVGASNPFNPFGVDLVPYKVGSASFNSWCANYGSANCTTTGVELIAMRRRPIDVQPRLQNQNVNTYYWNSGLKGYFDMLGGEWDWNVNASYSRNWQDSILTGNFNTARLQQALSNQCPSDPSCVPLNLFGGANPSQGTITPAMATYIGFEEHDIVVTNNRDYNANISGDLFDMPAGPVGAALGYEYLESDGFFHPDALVALGNTTGNASLPTNGRVATNAQYFEFNIPLVSNVPFMKDVSLDLADRFSQFKWGGTGPGSKYIPGADHASTARAALRWQATDSLLLRGSWSQGFRVPSISEFYSGVGNNFPPATDPCTTNAPNKAPFCAANGHPIVAPQSGGQINTIQGGNASLTPEKSISKTAGFVYSPDWLPGYDLSVDYYDINLVNTVSTAGVQNIINGCYFDNVTQFCKDISVIAGQINAVVDTNINTGSTITDGFDISTHYKFPSTSMGDFKLGLDINLLKRYDATVPNANMPSGYAVSRLAGWVNFPKRRATLSLNWHYGDWSAMWSMYYVDHTVEGCTNGQASPTTLLAACTYNYNASNAALYNYYYQLGFFPTPLPNNGPARTWDPQGQSTYFAQNHVGAVVYHDVEVTYHMDNWNTDFTFGIQNLFGKQPPSSISAFANSYEPFYNRIPGQFIYGRVSVKF